MAQMFPNDESWAKTLAKLRELIEQGQVAWDRTLVTRPEDEERVREAAEGATAPTNTHWRIRVSYGCPMGTILVINDEELDKISVGIDLSLPTLIDEFRGTWSIEGTATFGVRESLDSQGIVRISSW